MPVTPEARAVVFRRRRAIDWPALNIYIRKFIGERDWGRFLERYGIPPVDVVMAPNTTNAQRDDYLESAEAARDGRPAAWPTGSQISRAEGSRGQDPFSAFLEHQEKLVVLMATGGTLTSLAQADTGSLAGGAQMDVWTQIVARDGVAISAALNRDLFAPFLREAFQGRPVLARFDLGREDEPTADEAADMAVKLRGAGYRVDQAQLEEATGYKLEREAAPGGAGGSPAGMLFNKAEPGKTQAGRLRPQEETRLAAAMQRDLRPVAKAIAEGLKKRDWGALRKKLGGMLPECGTESADVLEDAMREAGGEAQKNKKNGEEGTIALANVTDANGMEHADKGSEGGGRFVFKDGGAEGREALPKTTPESSAPEGGEASDTTGGDEKKDKLARKRQRVAEEKLEQKPVRTIARFRTRHESDMSAQNAGYTSLDDMLGRAERIPESRVDEILTATIPKRCTAAEGVAVLASNPIVHDKAGNVIEVGENQIEKYCTGRFRAISKKTGKPLGPKVGNFEVVPYMLAAVKNDEDAIGRVKFAKGTTPDFRNTPFGAQREHRINTDSGPMHVFVYIKSTKDPTRGRINGWFVEGSGDGEA